MKIVVTGTDTDVGKTIFSAALAGALGACYWKPVQAGGLDRTDSDVARALSGLPATSILPESYRLETPCSPHRAAELQEMTIACAKRMLETTLREPLMSSGAGTLPSTERS